MRNKGDIEVSVCIPAFNGEACVAAAMSSVLAQTEPQFELLIVDDASDDGTLDVAKSFDDPRITVHSNRESLGLPGNWNRCLDLAVGDYVCILHQDDEMEPDNLRRKTDLLRSNVDIAFVHSAVHVVQAEGVTPMDTQWMEADSEDFVAMGEDYFWTLLIRGNMICAPSVVARRNLLRKIGSFDEDLGFACDYEAWMKLCGEGRIAYLADPLVRYHWHGANASHAFRYKRGAAEVNQAAERALTYVTDRFKDAGLLSRSREVLAEISKQRLWAADLEEARDWHAGQVRSWREKYNWQERTTQELRHAVEQQQSTTSKWQNTVEQQQSTICELQRVVEKHAATSQQLQHTVGQREITIQELHEQIKDRQRVLAMKQDELKQMHTHLRQWRKTKVGRLCLALGWFPQSLGGEEVEGYND